MRRKILVSNRIDDLIKSYRAGFLTPNEFISALPPSVRNEFIKSMKAKDKSVDADIADLDKKERLRKQVFGGATPSPQPPSIVSSGTAKAVGNSGATSAAIDGDTEGLEKRIDEDVRAEYRKLDQMKKRRKPAPRVQKGLTLFPTLGDPVNSVDLTHGKNNLVPIEKSHSCNTCGRLVKSVDPGLCTDCKSSFKRTRWHDSHLR